MDTLVTSEVDYPAEVKVEELGINLILGGHRETEVFGPKKLAGAIQRKLSFDAGPLW